MGLKNLKRLKSGVGSLLLSTATIRNPLGEAGDLNPVADLRGRRLLRSVRLQPLVRDYGRSACMCHLIRFSMISSMMSPYKSREPNVNLCVFHS